MHNTYIHILAISTLVRVNYVPCMDITSILRMHNNNIHILLASRVARIDRRTDENGSGGRF